METYPPRKKYDIMLLHLLLSILLVIFLVNFFPKKRKNQAFHPPPGPKGLPLIGNFHQYLQSSNTHIYFSMLGKTYGSIFALRLMRKSIVVIQSAKLAHEVFQTNDKNLCNRAITAGRKRLSYNGLDIAFSPYSEYLREMKKILVVQLLSPTKVEYYASIREEEVSRLIQKVLSLSSASKIVNLSQLILSYVSSNASRISFGKRYDNEEALGSRYYNLLQEAEATFTAFFYSDYFPLGGWLDKLTGRSSKLEKTFNDLDALYDIIIKDHLGANKLESEREDVVDFLLRLMNDNSFPYKLTMNHIKAILMNLFSGGAYSTTTGLIWALTELLKNPIPMKKVQDELRNAVPNKGCIAASDLPKLKYFKAVVKETFRLHPPLPLLMPHETIQKCSIEGYDILPKTMVVVSAWTIGRDPEYWKDPDEFMPERFMGDSTELKGYERISMIPFGGGKRMCPASVFGIANLELALANLLYSFDWELPADSNKEDIDIDVLFGFVVHKEKPLCLVAKKFL